MLTAARPHRIVSSLRTGHEDPSAHDSQLPPHFTVHELWIRALEDYRKTVGADLLNPNIPSALELATCETSDDIVDVIDGAARRLWKKREGSKTSQRLRKVLHPLVHGLSKILDASAETSSALVRIKMDCPGHGSMKTYRAYPEARECLRRCPSLSRVVPV